MTPPPGTKVIHLFRRVLIKKPEDRLTLVKILADNDYTVRIVREHRGKSTSYDYFVEFMPNKRPEDKGGTNEG